MVSDVLLLSYLDKIGLILTGEAGQALVYLYSEARLYKGARLSGLSLCSFPLKITAALSLHFQHLNED